MASGDELDQTQSQSQNTQENAWVNVDDDADIWGQLFRKRPLFNEDNATNPIDLTQSAFSAGRASDCDFRFVEGDIPTRKLNRLSKKHFHIVKDLSDINSPAFIEDCSRNGTYLNGDLIGINLKRILAHKDVISISHPAYKAFIYKDQRKDTHNLPLAITSKYHIGKTLGSGASGIVFLVHNIETCQPYALKFYKRNILVDKKSREAALNEAKIMRKLNHPCVVEMVDIMETPESMFLTFELMAGGDLLNRIQKNSFIPENLTKLIFYQICHAIKYLHDRKITHRDIKPDNILLATEDNETLVKITDFGLSKLVQSNTAMRTLCGTPLYVAPEILVTNGNGVYTQKVDVWSLGVVLFTCLSGTLPFANEYGTPATVQIKNGQYRFLSPRWRNVSDEAKKLIRRILSTDVAKRPSIDELLMDPWMAEDLDMVRKAHRLMNIPESSPEIQQASKRRRIQ